jgi:molecular chaperone GrpE
MRDALNALGVRPIEAKGKPFDPVFHNAVMQSPADDAHPAGTVIEEIKKGYMHNDKVLRHSMVSVAHES